MEPSAETSAETSAGAAMGPGDAAWRLCALSLALASMPRFARPAGAPRDEPAPQAVFGVLDGHGGARAADFATEHLHVRLAAALLAEVPEGGLVRPGDRLTRLG